MNYSIEDINSKIQHKEERLQYVNNKVSEYLSKNRLYKDMSIVKKAIIGSLGFGSLLICGIGMFTNGIQEANIVLDFVIPVSVITYSGVCVSHVFTDVYSKIKTGLTMGKLKKYLDENKEANMDYYKRSKNIYSDIVRLRVERSNLIKEQEKKKAQEVVEQQVLTKEPVKNSKIINFEDRYRILVRKYTKK